MATRRTTNTSRPQTGRRPSGDVSKRAAAARGGDVTNHDGPISDEVLVADKESGGTLKKNAAKWQIFLDFLFRHVTVVTFRYNCFEREELLAYMLALDRAEVLRSQIKPKKKKAKKKAGSAAKGAGKATPSLGAGSEKGAEPGADSAKKAETRISSLREMSDSCELLVRNDLVMESNRIRKFLDLVARMRGLGGVALGFYRALKKSDVQGLDALRDNVDYWRGLCLRAYDYSQLPVLQSGPVSFNALERRFICWPLALRTALHEAGRFLQRACTATGLRPGGLPAGASSAPPSAPQGPQLGPQSGLPLGCGLRQNRVVSAGGKAEMAKHMQAGEFVLAANIEKMMFAAAAEGWGGGGAGLGAKGAGHEEALRLLNGGVKPAGANTGDWELPSVDDVDPELLKPISDDSLLLDLPDEPPKDKKRKGKKKSGKGGGKSSSVGKKGKKKRK